MTERTRSQSEISVRPASAADEAHIARLWAGLMGELHTLDARQPHPLVDADRQYAARVMHTLGDPKMRVLIAERDTNVIGFALGALIDQSSDLFVPEVSGFIADLYVQPDARRGGVGRRLVEELRGWLTAQGAPYISLNVDSANTSGRAFWQTMGGAAYQVRMRIERE